ncbi:Acetyltransferase (GNAT) family protein [Vibrio thalassae]|uniref:Acetyltransferase (GNAT) family protein n=1 Tax=Vibrio thalassae TaxID=1243014 RepID=A0A240ELF4_9VIBR|nr:GNAT family N-acetyltransferase [Vibrio thalassae]SNX49083.1 Acetyltransferase (GNAT) family protein [Vibrio thalassae]
MLIREGTLEEVVSIVELIDEFAQKESVASLQARLESKKHLTLVAENDGKLLGFKIGYQVDDANFYSWFGGVSPLARKQGVAQILMEYQEHWAKQQGYQHITVKSRNQFPSMLRLLIKNGYFIYDCEQKQPIIESRIKFIKYL